MPLLLYNTQHQSVVHNRPSTTSAERTPRPGQTTGYCISRRCFLYSSPFLGGAFARQFGRVRSAGQAETNARDARLRSIGPTSYSTDAVHLCPQWEGIDTRPSLKGSGSEEGGYLGSLPVDAHRHSFPIGPLERAEIATADRPSGVPHPESGSGCKSR